jgi:DnaK suppressor protein
MNDRNVSGNTLGPEDLEEVTAELTRQAEALRTEIATTEETEASLRAEYELDAVDAGAKTASIDQLHIRNQRARALLEQTLAALDRIREGTFGICTACGRPLGRDRVMALPHAELCVTCRKQRETSSIG